MAVIENLFHILEINSQTCMNKHNISVGGGQGHQSYFNWVDPERFEGGGATAQEIIEILEDRFLETTNNQEIALKYNGVELIGDKGSLAYTNFFVGNITKGKTALAEARDFIRICSKEEFIDEEYLTGLIYVFDCLEFHMGTKDVNFKEENLDLWAKVPTYEGLCRKSKAAVFALKFYFYRQLRSDFDHQLEITNKMIELDPDHFQWHLCKTYILRFKRREVRYDLGQPVDPESFRDEIVEIELAKSLAPDNPLCNLEYCQLLAEILKRSKRMYQDWKTPLKCGSLEFSSLLDTVTYLKAECEKILKDYKESVNVNMTIADIYMKWLPRKHKDLHVTRRCLYTALALHPKSSKANHRLASFYMNMGPESSDISEAERFCILAAKYDPRNFPAVADLIQILLGDPEKNKARLTDIFDSHLTDSSAPFEKKKDELLFYKGLFLHLSSGYENEATTEWLKAQEIAVGDLHFDTLFYNHTRYEWPPGHLAIPKIRQTLQCSMADVSFSQGKEKEIEKLMACLDKAEEKEHAQLANNKSPSRGLGGGHRAKFRGHWGSQNVVTSGHWGSQNVVTSGHWGSQNVVTSGRRGGQNSRPRGQRGSHGPRFRPRGEGLRGNRGRRG